MATDWGISGLLESTVSTTAELLAFAGYPVDDESATYRMSMSVAFFRPVENGLTKSIIYIGGHPTIERLHY